jgi:hypothetical protein
VSSRIDSDGLKLRLDATDIVSILTNREVIDMLHENYSITISDLGKSQIWKVWTEVNSWAIWDQELEATHLDQPFASGAHFKLKPKGGPWIRAELCDVTPGRCFGVLVRFPGARMRMDHNLEASPKGVTVTQGLSLEGPLAFIWRRLVFAKLAAGLAQQTEQLLHRSRQLQSGVL